MTTRVALIDHHDSFTYNIVHALEAAGATVAVWRAQSGLLDAVTAWQPTHLVLSPGPQRPADHPVLTQTLAHFANDLPVLGICLGMQGMNEWAGGTLRRDHPPMHGKTSAIAHDQTGLFSGIPTPCHMMRYHSLVLDHVAPAFAVTARVADSNTVMAIAHRSRPLWGVQFHPESYASPWGARLFKNFLASHHLPR